MKRFSFVMILIILHTIVSRVVADNLMLSDIDMKAGETMEIVIGLDNPMNSYTAFQFDLILPEGISIAKDSYGEFIAGMSENRIIDHILYVTEVDTNTFRFLSYSMTNAGFKGINGPIIKVSIIAKEDIMMEKKTATIQSSLFIETSGNQSQLSDVSFNISVYEVPIIVMATSYTRVYGDENPIFEFTSEGVVLNGTPAISCDAKASSPVGTYKITIAKGDVANENVTFVDGTLTITKAPLTISAGNYSKKQGEANPKFTPTYTGFKNEETSAVLKTQPTVSCSATKDSPVGDYDVTVSGAVAENYNISFVKGSLTIEAVTPPTPEPQVTTFDEDVDNSASNKVIITFVVKENDSSGTPTVAISDDKDASGSISFPEAVTHNGVEYKVTEIGEGAFQNNTGLTEVLISASITSIGASAFASCTNLKSITVYNETPINLSVVSARGFTRTGSGDVFEGVDKETCILYVPQGSVNAYKAAPGWKDFKNILAIGTTGIYGIVVANGEAFDVFSISGQKVKSKTTSLDGLPRGIYIVNGRKIKAMLSK